MTVQIFMSLLMMFSTISSLLTEAIKKYNEHAKAQLPYNIIVLVASIIVSFLGMAIYCVQTNTPFGGINLLYTTVMCIATWMCSMLGYDKVKQAIQQFGGK